MPGKYSHALVLAGYEYRGLIDRHSPPTFPQFEPPIPASDSSRLSPSPSTSFILSQSPSSTPSTRAAAYRSNGVSDAQSQSNRLRSLSTTRSVSSYSTESSSHAAASVVTQIYAPLPPITSSTQLNQRHYSDNATPPASAHRSESHSNPSPQTTHTLSNHSSSPRSDSTVNTSLDSTSLIPTIPEKAVDEDEIYFGSDEEESDSLSTLSLPSSCQYIIKPWEHPDLHPDHFQFKPHYPPDSDDSQASSHSRQRGSSPDDAAPPPIARTRRVEFAQPPISSKSDLPGTKRASIIRRLSFLRPAISLSLPLPQRRSLSHSNHFSTGPPMSVPDADTSSRPLPIPARKSETLEPQPLEADYVKPTTRPWQASTFDIPWMDEAERNRYREKGVNPQLMAEMKSHRRSKWMGPLVGNTFIG